MSKIPKSKPPESNPGCTKNGHMIHMVFCIFLLIIFGPGFDPLREPVSIFFVAYPTVGFFYSFYHYLKLSKIEKKERLIKQYRELDFAVLSVAKENGGYLTPSIFSLQTSVSIEEAKQILDQYVQRGIAQIEVTDDGIVKYIFPELIEPPDSSKNK
ncbi:MAG: hypothetical protein ACK4SO_01355 [Candidatus Kapaibacteriota bacterium]